MAIILQKTQLTVKGVVSCQKANRFAKIPATLHGSE